MGHANYRNLSEFFLKELHERGKLSVKDATDLAVERGLYVSASEGKYYEDYMISQALSEIVADLLEYRHDRGGKVVPVVEAVSLSEEMERLVEEWKEDGEPEEEEDIEKLDAIEWRYTPEWRDRHIEVVGLRSVTH